MSIESYTGTAETRMTVASQLCGLAEDIAERSAKVAGLTHDRLQPVSRIAVDSAKNPSSPEESWPPLFDTLRSSLKRIGFNLGEIEQSIYATEV